MNYCPTGLLASSNCRSSAALGIYYRCRKPLLDIPHQYRRFLVCLHTISFQSLYVSTSEDCQILYQPHSTGHRSYLAHTGYVRSHIIELL